MLGILYKNTFILVQFFVSVTEMFEMINIQSSKIYAASNSSGRSTSVGYIILDFQGNNYIVIWEDIL